MMKYSLVHTPQSLIFLWELSSISNITLTLHKCMGKPVRVQHGHEVHESCLYVMQLSVCIHLPSWVNHIVGKCLPWKATHHEQTTLWQRPCMGLPLQWLQQWRLPHGNKNGEEWFHLSTPCVYKLMGAPSSGYLSILSLECYYHLHRCTHICPAECTVWLISVSVSSGLTGPIIVFSAVHAQPVHACSNIVPSVVNVYHHLFCWINGASIVCSMYNALCQLSSQSLHMLCVHVHICVDIILHCSFCVVVCLHVPSLIRLIWYSWSIGRVLPLSWPLRLP